MDASSMSLHGDRDLRLVGGDSGWCGAAQSAGNRRDGHDDAVRPDASVVWRSEPMRRVLSEVRQVGPTQATVLLLGETGVGKEVVARAIHDASPRRQSPMVRVSCAAIPSTLIESELFGHERGAFTGAFARQLGRFEVANGSTLFLDEIGDVSLDVQVKLLRVLEERAVERLGGDRSIRVDVRIIAATNRNLEAAVANHAFREDLFYRLNVFPIRIPPLRERVTDIPPLAWKFIDDMGGRAGARIESISSQSLLELERYPWPGNVRELRNVIERAMIVDSGPVLRPRVPNQMPSRPGESQRLTDVQTQHIRAVLAACGWRVRGVNGAAERLGLKPTTLDTLMGRLGIVRENGRIPA